jgi:hypothetical protein
MIYINEVEAASNLAEAATKLELVVRGEYDSEDSLYVEDEDSGDTRYTEQAQDVFDDWNDYYYEQLTKLDMKRGADSHIFQ